MSLLNCRIPEAHTIPSTPTHGKRRAFFRFGVLFLNASGYSAPAKAEILSLRDTLGIEAAQALLGHSRAAMTEHYAEQTEVKVIEAAKAAPQIN